VNSFSCPILISSSKFEALWRQRFNLTHLVFTCLPQCLAWSRFVAKMNKLPMHKRITLFHTKSLLWKWMSWWIDTTWPVLRVKVKGSDLSACFFSILHRVQIGQSVGLDFGINTWINILVLPILATTALNKSFYFAKHQFIFCKIRILTPTSK
jgi:hypothetical protein